MKSQKAQKPPFTKYSPELVLLASPLFIEPPAKRRGRDGYELRRASSQRRHGRGAEQQPQTLALGKRRLAALADRILL